MSGSHVQQDRIEPVVPSFRGIGFGGWGFRLWGFRAWGFWGLGFGVEHTQSLSASFLNPLLATPAQRFYQLETQAENVVKLRSVLCKG